MMTIKLYWPTNCLPNYPCQSQTPHNPYSSCHPVFFSCVAFICTCFQLIAPLNRLSRAKLQSMRSKRRSGAINVFNASLCFVYSVRSISLCGFVGLRDANWRTDQIASVAVCAALKSQHNCWPASTEHSC